MIYKILNKAFLIYVYVSFAFLSVLGYISNGWIGTIPGALGMIFVVVCFFYGVQFVGPDADL